MKTAALLLVAAAAHAGPARVGPGVYRPAFPASPAERAIPVPAFWLDREPVTNADYLAFVRAVPQWRRDRVRPIFVASDYLAGWAAADDLGAVSPRAPVVRVSWFAARAYCAWRGGRLPREAEWELAAAADGHRRDASADPAFQAQVLAWYAHPTRATLPDIGGAPNAWGIRDLHGLVWEWIDDFTAALVTADSRDPTRSQVCGAEAAAAKDPRAYATFLRFAFRGALDARDTIASLGFRCAYDREVSR
ncbi:MAG TPA: formylglycine-generating enzyme family protein [Kofleriaceae bacterium]|nr:formylglycine-generating enzyme family protein [Kofleriaceae bacterium]